jgi:arsenite methyltransferase
VLAPFGAPAQNQNMSPATSSINVEEAVKERYSAAAREQDASLCCPVTYDQSYLKVIPKEILERDYGCGDPSRHVRKGDTVLDLGSGGGKMCYIVSQVVGPQGRVIGVDMNDDMLALARKHRESVGHAIGWQNVEFRKGRIQDLALDLDRVDQDLKRRPIDSAAAYIEAEYRFAQLRANEPMIPPGSIDVVISNCVLNLVDAAAKGQLFEEIFRVLKVGGRAVISDIVSDRAVPESLMQNPELWSGCISGAFTETEFVQAFERVGFGRVEVLQRQATPWRVIEDIEFRSVTVEAVKKEASRPSDSHPRKVSARTIPSLSGDALPSFSPAVESCCGDSKCC